MPYICEKELTEIYKYIENKLLSHGFKTEIALIRDYMLKVKISENEQVLGKLIVDYSPKKQSHGYRKDSDLPQKQFERIFNILEGQAQIKLSNNKNKISESKTNNKVSFEKEALIDVSTIRYHAYVDGSFIDGNVGYGAVILKEGQIIKELKGRVVWTDALNSRQVGGEIQAVIEVLKWCDINNVDEIAIFYDFLNIEKWATGQYRTNTPMTQAYKEFIDRCKVKITWVKVESHTGIALNDRADELAKSGARQTSITEDNTDDCDEDKKSQFQQLCLFEPQEQLPEQMNLMDYIREKGKRSCKNGWLIYNGSLLTKKFTEHVDWFINAATNNGINLTAYKNDDFVPAVINNTLSLFGYDAADKPNFVIYWDKDIRLAFLLEKMGFNLYNNAKSIMICDDKILTHQILADNDIPMPLTIFSPFVFSGCKVEEEAFIDKIERVLSYPIVVKEAYGSFGALVYLAENRSGLIDLRKKLIDKPHLYQQYIETSYGRDVRLQVVGDTVVASMLRVNENHFKANITGGGKMMPFTPPKSFVDLAIKATKLVGADFAGVDLLF
ncbi:MAG: RimK family alpha-L-glutamate ligase, partial [Clostridiaceae bacterium]|nr:RimK family alpha-L-glutamate ligase [Clostridiaceae bacterium]